MVDIGSGSLTQVEERTWREWPRRYRSWERSTYIGAGDEFWRWATIEVLRWGVKTRGGFTVDRRVSPGDRPVIRRHLLGLLIREPVEVVDVLDTDTRMGFAYRTLPTHPVSGEEAFIIERTGDQVNLTIRSLTRASATWQWRVVYPLRLAAQAIARRRYRRAFRGVVRFAVGCRYGAGMIPAPSVRLRFREMTMADLDDMADLLGGPQVMEFYPAPKSRDDAARWIAWNEDNYATHGFGLWIIETHSGQFVGDCGLTWQDVNGVPMLEVGYHVRTALQGQGYATEAAAACRDFARTQIAATELVAIVHPDNTASEKVAQKIGMTRREDDHGGPIAVRAVLGMTL